MTQHSRFWNGTSLGDATDAPYDADTKFALVMSALAEAMRDNVGQSGVWLGALHGLQFTGVATPVAVDTGIAMVNGSWFYNDASASITIPTPISSTRIDRLVARKDWSGQTVRLTRIPGTEGTGVPPPFVRNLGATWDGAICQVSITTGGVITFVDERVCLGVRPGTITFDSLTANPIPGQANPSWVLMDHTAYSRALYPVLNYLYGKESYKYGNGDATTTFNAPWLIGRSPLVYDAAAAIVTGYTTLGITGGEQLHIILLAELASHNHGYTDPGHGHPGSTVAITDPTHFHGVFVLANGAGGGGGTFVAATGGTLASAAASTGITAAPTIASGSTGITVSSAGSNTGHNTIHPVQSVMGWVYLGGI